MRLKMSLHLQRHTTPRSQKNTRGQWSGRQLERSPSSEVTSTPSVMVSGPVIPFELKDGRIVRKYFYGHKTTKDVELPADFPIPGCGAYGG